MGIRDYRTVALAVIVVLLIAVQLIYSSFGSTKRLLTLSNETCQIIYDNLVPFKLNLKSIGFNDSNYYTFNKQMCPDYGNNLTIMILVMTAPSNKIKRGYIRKTWGHYGTRSDIGFGFLTGRVLNESIENDLQYENILYNDMIRADFYDSYKNLTLKTVSSLNWIDTYCNRTKFYLKCDDDVFINVPRLLKFIEQHENTTRTIYGRVVVNWKPFRNLQSKYYLSNTNFPSRVFPPFATGPSYMMTADCVHDLFVKALMTRPLKLEDVFITGIVAGALNITRVHVKEFTNDNLHKSGNIKSIVNNITTMHEIKPSQQFDFWKFSETP